jgi:hypothetical protein
MPTIIEIFLSKYIFLLLVWMYVAASIVIAIGFRSLKIYQRKDVIFRGIIMHGTYIFLSHSIGIMLLIIMYIFFIINSVRLNQVSSIIITLIAMIISNCIYVVSSNYLWERLAIEKLKSRDLTLYGLIITTPWYFILNIL